MADLRHPVLLLACTLLAAAPLQAQEYSHDGNRWYEVEVSLFAADYQRTRYSEITAAGLISPVYLPRLQELRTLASAYQVAFPSDQPLAPLPADGQLQVPGLQPLQLWLQTLQNGPLYSPALRDSFRIPDPVRDPYLELDTRSGQFLPVLRNLAGDGQYRVLWHKLWRQPMEGRAQVPSVFVAGGGSYGAHRELEGSLRLSDSGGQVMLDINVWLSAFARGIAVPEADRDSAESVWQLPAPPFPPVLPATTEPPAQAAWVVTEVWQQQQSRELGAGQLYYLDHPTLGVLVEIRPYVLPPRLTLGNQEDF